jgi:hypothetical protein
VAPSFEALCLFNSKDWRLFCHLDLLGFLINLKETFGANFCSMSNSCKLSPQQVSFLSWEWWTRLDRGIEISGKRSFHHLGHNDLLRLNIGKLDPI